MPEDNKLKTELEELQSKIEASNENYLKSVKSAGSTYTSAIESTTNDLNSGYGEISNKIKQAQKTYLDTVDKWITERDKEVEEQQARNVAQAENDRNVQVWGGLAEVASALSNLVGTSVGASNQKWVSPLPAWAERADQARREREAKLENYRNQLQALQQQKSQLKYAFASDTANRATRQLENLASRSDMKSKASYDTSLNLANAQNSANADNTNFSLKAISAETNKISVNNLAEEQRANREFKDKQLKLYAATYGYNLETGKFYNSKTNKYDLDAPEHPRGGISYKEKKQDIDDTIRATSVGSDVFNELAQAMGLESYEAYINLPPAQKGKYSQEYPAINGILRKFSDSSGNFKFTEADLGTLKTYAPNFHSRLTSGDYEDKDELDGPALP